MTKRMTMPLEILTIPCLSDNYAFLAHDAASGDTALIDAPESGPILAVLAQRGWTLTDVLITHHHDDHVMALPEILKTHAARVTGHAKDAARLPKLDRAVVEGDEISIGSETGKVLDVSGHTIGHIAFHFPHSYAAFTADSLMALGCGRVFEGTMDMMWESLQKLAALPSETMIYSGHEYTTANGNFAVTIEPENSDLTLRRRQIATHRAQNEPTVPSLLADELKTNPFLRANLSEVKIAIGMPDASDSEAFAEIRSRKDKF